MQRVGGECSRQKTKQDGNLASRANPGDLGEPGRTSEWQEAGKEDVGRDAVREARRARPCKVVLATPVKNSG